MGSSSETGRWKKGQKLFRFTNEGTEEGTVIYVEDIPQMPLVGIDKGDGVVFGLHSSLRQDGWFDPNKSI